MSEASMGTVLRRWLAAMLIVLAGASARPVAAAERDTSTWRGAAVRVEVVERDGARRRATQTVAWQDTARLQLAVGGHDHILAVTPSEQDRGIALVVDHSRDGALLVDDLRIASEGHRAVLEHADGTVVITLVPIVAAVAIEPG